MQRAIRIAPSILSADFARLGEELRAVVKAGADLVHVDVMDGHFVPNLTIGPEVVRALKAHASVPLDVHLMIEPVDPYVAAFAEAGADIITVHVEATPDPGRTLGLVKEAGCAAGISLKPATPAKAILPWLDRVDLVLVMTVEPGFGGQAFMRSELAKIREIRAAIDARGRAVALEVDGGINPQTARAAVEAGADVLVAGSATFEGGPKTYAANIARLREAASRPDNPRREHPPAARRSKFSYARASRPAPDTGK